ncbi:hypothetical protein B0T25DRAFT_577053 [Lasiosphaeria hispida]|uniref:NACHT domain-containing protein n=1 Tax=Lasiosphaeria hispida TaxID=260671 RepID=A0AAJ0MH20_9PEZI|nr:hypothetical protein B0T25DRAFT_577053 [Lasiosphaeria hispida]
MATPASTQTTPVSTRYCWDLAVKIFNTELTKDPTKIMFGDRANTSFPHCSLSEVIVAAKRARDERARDRPRFRVKMDAFLTVMSRHCVAIDVMIEHSPHITAIVWGGLRLLITTAAREIELSEQIGAAVVLIAGEVARWEQHLQLHSASPRVRSTVARLYAHVISFSIRSARLEGETGGLGQYLKAAVTSVSAQQKLRNILASIEDLTMVLERETCLASQVVQMEEAREQRLFRSEVQDVQQQIFNIANRRLILDWLEPARARPASPARWEDGTCEWIWHDAGYKKWEQGRCVNPLWIYGIPGSGKTVIASYMSQNAPTRFVFTHTYALSGIQGPGDNPEVSLVASLLAQVLEAHVPGAVSHMQPLVDQFSSCTRCPPSQLWSRLRTALAAIPEAFTILVDALDECRDVGDLHSTLQHLGALGRDLAWARIILISRFKGEYARILPAAVHLPMDTTALSSDITHFVEQEISRNPKLEMLRHEIIKKAETDAQGMFLWAKMMIEYLKRAPTLRCQRESLRRFPAGLSAVYDRFLAETGQQLDQDQLVFRRQIFMMLVTAERPPLVEDISTAVALRSTEPLNPSDMLVQPETDIMHLCWPLVCIRDDRVQLMHLSVREFLLSEPREAMPKTSVRVSLEDAHKYMAHVCLNQLGQPAFSTLATITSLLRGNVCPELEPNPPPPSEPPVPGLYEYACLYWHIHVVASPADGALADQVNRFLHERPFIAWAETRFRLRPGNDLSPVLSARAALLNWQALRPAPTRAPLRLDDFFTSPYESALATAPFDCPTTMLRYLTLHRLNLYLNIASQDPSRRHSLTQEILRGADALLGPTHAFTLRSAAAFALEQINHHHFSSASTLLGQVVVHQPPRSPERHTTQSYLALAMYHQLQLPAATALHEEACTGLLHAVGPASKKHAKALLFLAWSLEAGGALDRAAAAYGVVWARWGAAAYTPDEPLGMMAQAGLATVLRKRGEYGAARRHGAEVLAHRQRVYGERNRVTVDVVLNMAVLCREAGDRDGARAYLELARAGLDAGHGDGFLRVCLATRLEAGLLVADGEVARAAVMLGGLLSQGEERGGGGNRELLWARLELAALLRAEGRAAEALACFEGLVDQLPGGGSRAEGCSRGQLMVVERAVACIKGNDIDSAHRMLSENGLRWKREEDYWIPEGGPFAGI